MKKLSVWVERVLSGVGRMNVGRVRWFLLIAPSSKSGETLREIKDQRATRVSLHSSDAILLRDHAMGVGSTRRAGVVNEKAIKASLG